MSVLWATHDNQTVDGGAGADQISVTPFIGVDHAVLNGWGGDDTLNGMGGHFTVLNGGAGADTVFGHDGDSFIGGSGFDSAVIDLTATDTGITADLSGLGTSATVTISTATVATVELALIALGDGADHITTSSKAQVGIYAGGGDDVLTGKGGVDVLAGGSGSDLVKGGDGADLLYGYAPDQMFGFDVPGLGSDDGSGRDTLLGGAGEDILTGSLGDDRLDGGSGVDTVSYANAGAVSIDLHHAKQHTLGAGVDTLISIENVIGSSAADHLVGGDGSNALAGGDGADTIDGGDGSDVLSGGAGADVFVFSAAHDSGDAILDLASEDRIDLSKIDADTGKAGDQAFHLVDHLTGHAGELMVTYDSGSDTTLVVGTTGNDPIPDFGMVLNGDQTGFTGWVL